MSIDNGVEDIYHSLGEDPLNEDAYDWIVAGPETKEHETEQSNKILREQMRGLKRTKRKLCKNGCGNQIYVQEEKNGSWQPYNQNDRMVHGCNTGRNYNQTGIHGLGIKYNHKTGCFCESCKNILIENDLIEVTQNI